jgi:hypothetical protein
LGSQEFSEARRQTIRSVEIQDVISIPSENLTSYLVLVHFNYTLSDPQLCLLPCAFAIGQAAEQVRKFHSDSIIADLLNGCRRESHFV